MGLKEAILGNGQPDEQAGMREQLLTSQWQAELLQENLRQLELSIGDEGWRKLGAQLEKEFTRTGLDDLMAMSRAMYLSNPLIQRAVNVRAYYTWAQGVTFQSDDGDMQTMIDEMTADPGNKAELYGHQARILTDIDQAVDGNVFLALFTADDGKVYPRSLPADEVREIIHDPDDRAKIWYYRRKWNQRVLNTDTGNTEVEVKEALYPDWRFEPGEGSKPDSYGSVPVEWKAPVIHQRTGGLKQMQFGIPETYAAIDWARAYKRFLEDWHTIVSSLARFAWNLTTKGRRVDEAARKIGAPSIKEREEDPDAKHTAPGAVFVGAGDELTPIPKTGATTSAEDAKPSRLMVASAMDLPDTILSNDPQQGALATAKTLDRPTELGLVSRQEMWKDLHIAIFSYASAQKKGKANMPEASDVDVEVSFPPILEHDQTEVIGALVSAATLDGKTEAGTMPHDELARLLMDTVGVEDIEQALKDAAAEQEERDAKAEQIAQQQDSADREEAENLAKAAERLAEGLK